MNVVIFVALSLVLLLLYVGSFTGCLMSVREAVAQRDFFVAISFAGFAGLTTVACTLMGRTLVHALLLS